MMLLEFAAQLDRQLDGAPFQELLASHGHYRSVLLRSPNEDDYRIKPRKVLASDGEDVASRFVAALQRRAADRPVVFVLDTFEEALRPAVHPEELLALMREVVERSPAARVVIAGRYDFRDRPTAAAELPEAAHHELLFPPDEQRRYLTDVRGIRDEPTITEVQRLAEGLPLTMSMYADLIERNRNVTAATLATYQDPGLQAAIDRVVTRVEDRRVRWLLRYGVVPRRLSFDFVVDVMWRFLNPGMAEGSALDDPGDDPARSSVDDQVAFPTGLDPVETVEELQVLWHNLLKYAADYSWVVAAEDRQSVQFRPDLISPLRRLISNKPVYAALQRAAADYYRKRAAASPTLWQRWTTEAVFHLLQVDVDDGAQAWRAAIATARSRRRDDWCLDFATDLLGSEFVDDRTGAPTGGMTPQLLAEAHLERARAAAALAESKAARSKAVRTAQTAAETSRSADPDPLWVDFDDGYAAALALRQQDPDIVLPEQDLLVVEFHATARGHSKGDLDRLRGRREQVDESTLSPGNLAMLDRTLGQAMTAVGESGGAAYLEASYERAKDAEDPSAARLSALYQISWLIESGQCAEALDMLRRAEADGLFGAADDDGLSMWAWLYDELALSERAIEQARKLLDGGQRRAQAHLMISGSLCDVARPAEALDEVAKSRAAAQADAETLADLAVRALAVEGLCLAMMHESGPAVECLLAAAARARELRDVNQAAYMAAVASAVHLLVAGNLREAEQALDEAARADPEPCGQGWTMVRVVRALLLARVDRAQEADVILREAMTMLREQSAVPKLRIQIATAGLAVAPSSAAWAQELIERLTEVTPVAARVPKLFWTSEVPAEVAPEARERLLAVALGVGGGALDEPERTPAETVQHVQRIAEVLRIAGERGRAREFLTAVAEYQRNVVEWSSWIEAMQRLGPATPDEPLPPDDMLANDSAVTASVLIMLARRRLALDGAEVAEARLVRAEQILAGQAVVNCRTAELALGRAEIARARAEHVQANRYASAAARTYEQLGAFVLRNRVARDFELGERDHTPDPESVQIRFGQPRDGRLEVVMRLPDGQEMTRVATPGIFDRVSPSDVLGRARTALAPLLEGWRTWSEQIGERCLPHELAVALAPNEGQYRDLRLVFASSDVASLPWELCQAWESGVPLAQHSAIHDLYRSVRAHRRNETRIRILQEGLRQLGLFQGVPDGLVGPGTTGALETFQRTRGVDERGPGRASFAQLREELTQRNARRLRVLVVRPDAHAQLERQRGDLAIGTGLAGIYAMHGADVEELEMSVSSARRAVLSRARGFRPDVVHVAASVRYAGGAVMLDLGGDAGHRSLSRTGAGWDALTVSELNGLLSAVGYGRTVPLVIIDVPSAGSLPETVRACGGRNSFAHQLLGVGGAQAVLATGLAEPHDQIEILNTIAARLANGEDIAEVVRQLHGARPARTSETPTVLAFAGMALFLERPPYSLFPVWAL